MLTRFVKIQLIIFTILTLKKQEWAKVSGMQAVSVPQRGKTVAPGSGAW